MSSPPTTSAESDSRVFPYWRLLNFPPDAPESDEESHPVYWDSLAHTQTAIIRLVNAYPYADLNNPLLDRLASLISHHPSAHYVTRFDSHVAQQFRDCMRCIFLWMKASDLSLGNQSSIAPFAILFFIHCDEKYRAIALAKALLEFIWIQAHHVYIARSVDMVSVCYKFTNVGVLGIMFYDLGLEEPYQRVVDDCREGYQGFDMFGDHPVSFWPPGCPVKVRDGSYESLFKQTRPLYKFKNTRPVPFRDVTNTS